MNKNFFSKKNILITGNTGFKGSWLTKVLLKFNANIIGYSNTEITLDNERYVLNNLKKCKQFINAHIQNGENNENN